MRARLLGGLGALVTISVVAIPLRSVVATTPRAGPPVTAQLSGLAATPDQWVSIGPSPLINPNNSTCFYSSRLSSIAVDPGDSTHWLAGFGNGGVWETHDTGTSWAPLSDTWPTLAIGAVAFARSDPRIIYVGTGESDGGLGFEHAGLGMVKSADGGHTWTVLAASTFARGSVKRVRVHPTNPDVVLAATSRGGFGRDAQEGAPSPPAFGILKSSDGGVTWVRTLAGQATALEIDPATFNMIAAIGEQRTPNGVNNDSPGGVPNGVYRSTDGGQTWSFISGPWGSSPSPIRSTVGRIELAIAPSNPNVLYASIQVPPNGGTSATGLLGLWRTDNAWTAAPTWTQIPTDATPSGGYCGPVKCGYSHVISVDPGDANRLFAGGAELGLWRCSNCTSSPTWTNVTPSNTICTHPDHHALTWAGNRLIDGNDGGAFSTTDFGASWQNHNARLSTGTFYSGALHPTDPNVILAGPRDSNPAVRRGGSWTYLRPSAAGEWGEAEVAISSTHPDTDWMAAWIWGVIVRTTDGGQSGIRADAGIDIGEANGSAFVAPVRKCPSDDNVFLTGTNRMWRTDNFFSSAAPSWVANGPPHPYSILTIAYVAGDTRCTTYAFGNRGGQVQMTRDGGRTWTDLDAGKTLPARPVNGLAFDPASPDTLYVGLSSFDGATPGKGGHVFKTGNALAGSPSWVNVSPPDDVPFNAIALDPRDPRFVYAGSDTGLWRSTDGAATWQKMGPETGLPNASVYDIQINPSTNRTVVFTYGRGAYMLTTAPSG